MSRIAQAALSTTLNGLRTTWKYARVEMKPPTPREFGEVRAGYRNLMNAIKEKRWRQTTVREAWLNSMVTLEVIFWFYLGEVIGRGSLYGYVIPHHGSHH